MTTPPDTRSDVPWLTSDRRARVPDTSMLPGTEKAPAAAVTRLNHAVQGAHDTLDRLADHVAPAVQQLGEKLSDAEDAWQAKSDALRHARDEWVEGARGTVRGHPLVAVAAALALGALIARLVR